MAAYELLPRNPEEGRRRSSDSDNDDDTGDILGSSTAPAWWQPPFLRSAQQRFRYVPLDTSRITRHAPHSLRRAVRYACITIAAIPAFIILVVLMTCIFFPSYTRPPKHYAQLRKRVTQSTLPGRANVNNEKVFIACALYDKGGALLNGQWGQQLHQLIDLLGPDNVFLSIYENDPDPDALTALEQFRSQVKSQSAIVQEHLPHASLPRVMLPSGDTRLKRVAFLAEVRNRALAPLLTSPIGDIKFDKLLYVNDVFFSPLDAAQLLFSTNQDPKTGRTSYGAACAVDFISSWKFYDRFATRGLDGETMGVPIYPWFDAVRLRGCWGGMTAFEARWFQENVTTVERPYLSFTKDTPHVIPGGIGLNPAGALRFRYETDTFWDASECCLIHADLQYARSGFNIQDDSGIYMNPYVRVAYDPDTLSWLGWTRLPERLYSGVQHLANRKVGFPQHNPRAGEEPGDMVRERVWKAPSPDHAPGESTTGAYESVERVVGPGRFCGAGDVLVLNEDGKGGHNGWMSIGPPPDNGA
ncbi:cryptococcal mannosyltransferase 1-domain-containing protein [Auriculariales sp. MPI-PUGE-AT-0066]|nr:cryptococcal mannosyltransferase 1-domain-containing protein [Auriculariales sp. MPI-PUGE-AT-0066]